MAHASHASTDSIWCPLTEPHEIYEMLVSLKSSKATGSDSIPARLLKEGALFLAEPLCHILNSCIIDRCMPTLWKFGIVTPIPKTSPPAFDQLRPITLLPEMGKILERIVLSSVKDEFLSHVDKRQYAYVPHSSTASALIQLHDYITRLMDVDDSIAVSLLSLDYSKAFDTISHDKLLQKLQSANFPDGFVEWCRSYLCNRCQAVRIGDFTSDVVHVSSGVPQGSIIGPFLFIFYTADLITNEDLYIKYADDTMIIHQVTCDIKESVSAIQRCLESIEDKSKSLCLNLNKSKSKLMIFPKFKLDSRVLDEISIPHITRTNSLTLLGVKFTSNLKWDEHIDTILRKCNSRLYALRILRKVVTETVLQQTYKGLILSLLDYSASVFVSLPMHLQDKLKHLQKRCHRIVHNFDCTCKDFENVNDRRLRLAGKLFTSAERNTAHPLHDLIPERLERTKNFVIEFAKTQRRQRQFQIFMSIYFNNFL